MNDVATLEKIMVQGTGFEPAKHYALGPKPSPFDHSGTPAWPLGVNHQSRTQRLEGQPSNRVLTPICDGNMWHV